MVNKETDPALEPALRDVDSIQNLDTARLALRWALERMRTLEKRVHEVEGAVKLAEDVRAKAASELDGARDLLTRRAGESLERERYYAKIEEYLNLKLEGGLDAATMAQRETRIDAREAELQRREIETENRIKTAKLRLDEELRRAQADAAASAEARVKDARGEFERRGVARDKEFSERQLAAFEKEAQLSALERSLEERRKRFEEFHAAQRAALERESASIAQAASDQAEFLERRVEMAMAAKTAAFDRAWQSDKQALLEELSAWRGKAREHLPELIEAQASAASLAEERTRLSGENSRLVKGQEILNAELRRLRAEAETVLPSTLAAVRRAVEAEEKAERLEGALVAARRAAEESQAERLSAELSHETRAKELARLESALAASLRDAEQNLFRQYDAWIGREAELRRRDQDWRREAEARRESVDVLRAEITAQREELKREIAAYRAKTKAADRKDGPSHPGDHS